MVKSSFLSLQAYNEKSIKAVADNKEYNRTFLEAIGALGKIIIKRVATRG
jgi:hypothetical protein